MQQIVMYVDDDQNALNAFRRTFRDEPYEIMVASKPEEALNILEGIKIDMVISDYNMPRICGTELLSIIRGKYTDTKRMMLTGEASLSVAMDAINDGGIQQFFTKPYNTIDLGIAIRNALEEEAIAKSSWPAAAGSYDEDHDLLESAYPGITRVERDNTGRIMLEDDITDLVFETDSESSTQDVLRESYELLTRLRDRLL